MTRKCSRWALVSWALLAVVSSPAHCASPYRFWANGPSTSPDYFPIGVWLQDPLHAERYRSLGVNLYVGLWNGPTATQLSALRAAGMQAIATQNALALADGGDTIIGWMHDDEPDNAQPDEKYHEIRRADPTRPVWLNLGRGVGWDGWFGRGPRTNHPEDYPEYLKGADIASFDIYPGASKEVAIKNQFWRVPYGVDRLKRWSRPGTPVWAFIETGNITGHGSATPAQVRATTWAAIASGATGITYFVHQFAPSRTDRRLLGDAAMLESVTATNQMISNLARVLNSPTIDGARVERSAARPQLQLMRKDHGGNIYLFAVNLGGGASDVAIQVDGAAWELDAEVVGEGRSARLSAGKLTDHFSPYAVHIYKVAPPAAGARN
jgi:hypothetical protein